MLTACLVAGLTPLWLNAARAGADGPGVAYQVFDGYWNGLPDFSSMTPVGTGLVPGFDLAAAGSRSEGFGLRFTACLAVPAAGTWTFTTVSDDGSKLHLNGSPLVNNDGLHAPEARSRAVSLEAGTYPIVVDYNEYGGGETLEVHWQGPGTAQAPIPPAALSQGQCPPVPVTGGGGGSGGVAYQVFEGYWNGLPDFGSMTPAGSGSVAAFDLAAAGSRSEGFGLRFSSCLAVPAAGTWTFTTVSDDGSKLHLNGSLVVNNDGLHAPQARSQAVSLEAGTHPIVVDYNEYGGGETLDVYWQGPGAAQAPIPSTALTQGPCSPGGGGGVNQPPTVTDPGNQTSTAGQAASLAIAASDPEGAPLTFGASGLPPGLAIAPSTGVISGTPTSPGAYGVTVSVSDGVSAASRSFTWTVTAVPGQPGTVWTAAGQGLEYMRTHGGDGGPARQATFAWAHDAVVDSAGNLYVADMEGHRVRRVDRASGIINTVVGTGAEGYGGDGGPGTAAVLNRPINLTVDAQDNVYIADWGNGRVRRWDATSGIITTVAGSGPSGAVGDGGPATAARLDWPEGMSLDAAGNLFVAEFAANRVRRVDGATGIITTVAGRGEQASDGDGGPATAAAIHGPTGVKLDAGGNLYITDYYGNRVRIVDQATGIISTLVGDGQEGFAGDGGPASASRINHPGAVALDLARNHMYILDRNNGRIRRVDNLGRGTIQTVAGGGTSRGEGDAALAANIGATGLWFDSFTGDVYYAEPYYTAVRRVIGPLP